MIGPPEFDEQLPRGHLRITLFQAFRLQLQNIRPLPPPTARLSAPPKVMVPERPGSATHAHSMTAPSTRHGSPASRPHSRNGTEIQIDVDSAPPLFAQVCPLLSRPFRLPSARSARHRNGHASDDPDALKPTPSLQTSDGISTLFHDAGRTALTPPIGRQIFSNQNCQPCRHPDAGRPGLRRRPCAPRQHRAHALAPRHAAQRNAWPIPLNTLEEVAALALSPKDPR